MKPPSLNRWLLPLLLASNNAKAADGTWTDISVGPNNWSNSLMWSGGTIADGSGFTALFSSNIAATTTVNLDSARTIGNLTFSDNGASGSSWVLSGSNALTLAGGSTSTITATTAATINSQLSGTNSLTKAGSAVLTLSATNNNYSGGTIINSGELRVNAGTIASGTYTTLGSGSVTVNSGSTLRFFAGSTSNAYTYANAINLNSATLSYEDGNQILTGNVALTGSNTVSGVWSGKTLTMSGIVSGTGSLTHGGFSTLTLSAVNTYTGNTAVTGGTLIVGGAGQLGSGTYSNTLAISSGATFSHTSSASQALTGVISGAGSLTKNGGAGVLTLSGTSNNTYTGGTTITNGTISIGTGGTGTATSTVAALGTGSVSINSGGILKLWIKNDASFSIANNLTINGGTLRNEDGNHTMTGTVAVGTNGATFQAVYSGKNLTVNGVVSGSGSVTAQGLSGQVRLLGTNTYTGATTVSSGTLVIGSANASSGFSVASGATLALRNLTLGSTQNITGAGNVSKDLAAFGDSTITGTNNTYTGSTTVNISRFTLGSTGVINGTSGIAVQAQWGANFNNLGSITTPGAITVAGTGDLTSGGVTTDSSFFRNSGTINAASITLNSSSSANKTANRGGTFTQTAGTTTLSGTATLAANGGTGAAGTAGNDATFNLTGGTFSTGTLAVNSGTVTATGGTLNIGSGGITQTGTAATQVNLGATTVGATSAWTSSVAMSLTNSTTGTTFNTTGGNIGLSGALSGSGALVKSGSGTLTLSGTGTYSGSTSVSAGTLLVTGALGNTSISVANGAALINNGIVGGTVTVDTTGSVSGTGSYTGAVTINGALNPGNSPGFQSYGDSLTLGTSAITNFELGGISRSTLLSSGTGFYDAIDVATTLTLDGTINVSWFGGFTAAQGDSFNLFDATTFNASGFSVGSDLVLPTLATGLTWDTSSFTTNGVISVVPEPRAALLGGLGLLALMRRRRVA